MIAVIKGIFPANLKIRMFLHMTLFRSHIRIQKITCRTYFTIYSDFYKYKKNASYKAKKSLPEGRLFSRFGFLFTSLNFCLIWPLPSNRHFPLRSELYPCCPPGQTESILPTKSPHISEYTASRVLRHKPDHMRFLQ